MNLAIWIRSATFAAALWLGTPSGVTAQTASQPSPATTSAPTAAPSANVTPAATPSPVGAPTPTPSAALPSPAPSPTSESQATGQMLTLPALPSAYVEGKSTHDDVYSAILSALATVRSEIEKAGLKVAGPAIAVFLEADDAGFTFRAEIPIEAAPVGKTQLTDLVKIGQTPGGKAMRFEHRGAYDDIDATYEAITAYLDEKGIDAEDVFVEQYLNDIKTSDDPNLQVDIFVLLK